VSALQFLGARKESWHFAVVVLYPPEAMLQLRTVDAAKAWAVEIARKRTRERIYKAPDLDALASKAEGVLLDLRPLWHAHQVLDDGTKVWLSEAERVFPRWKQGWGKMVGDAGCFSERVESSASPPDQKSLAEVQPEDRSNWPGYS
jgi:hypothetical protein